MADDGFDYVPVSTVASPCVNICRISPRDGLCEGCRRTLGEIGEWASASDDRRRAILAAIAERG